MCLVGIQFNKKMYNLALTSGETGYFNFDLFKKNSSRIMILIAKKRKKMLVIRDILL